MNRAIIVHCWEGVPDYCWYPYAKTELEQTGFSVEVPEMPDTENPDYSAWLEKLQQVVDEPDENLFLIGHSIGSVAILRYLESLPENVSVGGVVLVAGFTDNLGFDEIQTFFTTPLDYKKIRASAGSFSFIHSDDDPYVELRHGEQLRQQLGGNLIVIPGAGHFSGPVDDEKSYKRLPEVIEEVKRQAKKY